MSHSARSSPARAGHLAVVLAAVSLLSLPWQAAGQAPLRFVGDRDYSPLSYLDKGEPKGFDVDVVRAVAKLLGRDVRIDLMDWADAQLAVQRGEADGLTDLAISDERRALYEFAESTVTHEFGLFVRMGSTTSGSIDSVRGKTVGVTMGGFPRAFFQQQPDVRLREVANYEDGFDRLIAGSLDAVAADIWVGASSVERRDLKGLTLGSEPFAKLPAAIAVRKGNTALITEINRAIRELKANGTLQTIQDRWRPQEILFLSRERAWNLMVVGGGGLLVLLLAATTVWALTLRRQVRVRRAIESQLGLALSAANMGTWRWFAATNLETRDANLNRILGLDPVESTQALDDVFELVHPDDREAMRGEFQRAIREHVAFLKEFRIVQPGGAVRTLRGRGRAFYTESDDPLYVTGVAIDVTEETQAAARSRLLAHALQSANDCIVITDPSSRIVYVNDAFLRTFEYTEGEILGQSIGVIHADDTRSQLTNIGLPAGEANGWRGESIHQSKYGRVFPVSVATSVVRDPRGEVSAIVEVAREISHEKLAEDALRASEEKFFKAFEASPDAIVIIDFETGIQMVNEAFERISGYSRSEVIGRTIAELELFVDQDFVDDAIERLRQAGVSRDVELQIRRRSGEVSTILASGATIEIAGRPCFLTVSRDISERRRFELHLRQAAELNKLLLTEVDFDGLSQAVIESAQTILPLDYASLVLYEPDGQTLRLKAERGLPDASRSTTAAQALAVIALKQDTVQIFRRGELDALGPPVEALLRNGVCTACCLPLATAQGTLGAIVVGSTNPNAFSEDDVTLLRQLSTYGAIAIQNARSFEEIKALKDQLSLEKLYLEEEIRVAHNFADIVGESPSIKRVLWQIETVAPTDASVLILGETGTGKELLARALHELSPRKDRTFVKVSVGALPATLLESELFGYERGAFTGATTSKMGRMELAHRGTLFLDEVGDIPLEMQPKLLRVLQEREFERLGSTRTQRADVRLIAATNRNLQQMVAEGTFRSDLFYRLNVFPLEVPPLRKRSEDIPNLVRHFVQKFSTLMKKRITSISASTMTALQEWHWPGNIRELENVIERAVIISSGGVLQVPPFQVRPTVEAPAPKARAVTPPQAPIQTFADGEREIILQALREAEGVIAGPTGAAARLGIKRTTLQSRMRKLGISRPSF